eukprot:gnl/Chilomastix_caulleri/323.p1 GENE.gnl/Chilomastix_caulleri/323~~gnl/Chilomastix_caulleri/323.p1  ORF type:complete len:140 (+),score=17.95 gnl/Chilomastix_caulleri/323:42-461(+)
MELDDSCIFCKIIKGDIPCCKLYEDDKVISFLDINPVSEGHFLVVPKHHTKMIHDLPDEFSSQIFPTISKLVKASGFENYNIVVNNGSESGQMVPHVHVHVIQAPSKLSDGIKVTGSEHKEPDFAKLAEVAKRITENLE